MPSQFTCMDCGHIFPESQLSRWIGEFGSYLGCPKCQCDDLDETLVAVVSNRVAEDVQ